MPERGRARPTHLRQVQDGPERRTREGDSPVVLAGAKGGAAEQEHKQSESSVAWECSVKLGGGFLPRLNICLRPISHKYREGKVKRTLKRESNRARNYDDGNLCSLHKRKARGNLRCEAGTQLRFGVSCPPLRGASSDTQVSGVPPGATKRGRARRLLGFRGGTTHFPLLEPCAPLPSQRASPSGGQSPDVCLHGLPRSLKGPGGARCLRVGCGGVYSAAGPPACKSNMVLSVL